jgi:cell division protein FtsZ
MMTEPEKQNAGIAQVKVVGVGGGGCNAVSRMFRERIPGIDYLALNTDAQALTRCEVPVRVRIGDRLTRGLGVGGNPEVGRESAEESRDEINELISDSDMIFVAAGMGGGTGTGAAPLVAEISKESGALTIAIVTKPFDFEGARRMQNAEIGIQALRQHVDTLIVIPNQRLLALCDEEVTMDSAFRLADNALRQGVQAIADLVTVPGEINLDFADVKSIMSGAGQAWMSIGTGTGENRAVEAAKAAVASPLLDVDIDGAKGVLLNITGGTDLKLHELEKAAEVIRNVADPKANIIFGMVTDPKMEDEVRVTIIATGFNMADDDPYNNDNQVSQLIMDALEGDADLDIPPFLRRQAADRRRSQNAVHAIENS